ncbi:MAG: CBS domain-containing protein [Phycisphaerae bacterium]|nr:CBS domain-containing protein [Phycisphaerae bacterium]
MATTIADVMTKNPVCATPGMSIRQLAGLFAEHGVSGAPVTGPDGKLVGVVSRTDLFRRVTAEASGPSADYLFDLLNDRAPADKQPMPEPLIVVGDFMSESPVTAVATDTVAHVARIMAERRVHRVVVVDANKKPVGVVTTLDLLRVFPA